MLAGYVGEGQGDARVVWAPALSSSRAPPSNLSRRCGPFPVQLRPWRCPTSSVHAVHPCSLARQQRSFLFRPSRSSPAVVGRSSPSQAAVHASLSVVEATDGARNAAASPQRPLDGRRRLAKQKFSLVARDHAGCFVTGKMREA